MAGSYLVPMDLPHLDAALRDTGSATAEVRWVAALALAQTEGPRAEEAVGALQRLVEDPVEEVRAQAVEGLAGHARSGRRIQRALVAAALEDASDLVRMTGIEAIDVFTEEPVAVLAPMLEDTAPGVRIAAVGMLAELGAEGEVERVALLLGDPDEVVRREAAMALARLGDSRGRELSIEALGADENIAIPAALALGALGDARAVEALRRAAEGWFKSAALRGVAAAALVRSGDPAGLEIIGRMLRSMRGATRMAALVALARLPIRGIAPRVGELIAPGRPLEASSALRTLVALAEVDRDAARAEIARRKGQLGRELEAEIAEALESLSEAGP
jgi:HEAT repeat protein